MKHMPTTGHDKKVTEDFWRGKYSQKVIGISIEFVKYIKVVECNVPGSKYRHNGQTTLSMIVASIGLQ